MQSLACSAIDDRHLQYNAVASATDSTVPTTCKGGRYTDSVSAADMHLISSCARPVVWVWATQSCTDTDHARRASVTRRGLVVIKQPQWNTHGGGSGWRADTSVLAPYDSAHDHATRTGGNEAKPRCWWPTNTPDVIVLIDARTLSNGFQYDVCIPQVTTSFMYDAHP
jgi:hypothetical protein